jgi:hypothetical protein
VEHVVITSTLTEQSKDKVKKLINANLVQKLSPEKVGRLCEESPTDASIRRANN